MRTDQRTADGGRLKAGSPAHIDHHFHSKHAALQEHSSLSPVPAPDATFHPPGERHSNVAVNIREASGRAHKTRQSLATAAGLDIRTINRMYSAEAVQRHSLRAVAGAMGVSEQQLRLAPEDFVRVLDIRDARRRRRAEAERLAATIREPVSRLPWWRRVVRGLLRAISRA